MILVVCALPQELPDFVSSENVELLACGVGPVEAAITTACALATRRYDAVINAGIAGAFRGCGNVGDTYIASEEILADFGREDGGPLNLPNGATLAQRVASAEMLLARARALPHRIARGLTVTQITTSHATAQRLRDAHQADIESMEGFAVLRAAERAGVPAIEVRGISNIVGDRAASEWDFQAGARAAVTALRALLPLLGA